MKKDEFADFNKTKKHRKGPVVIVAIVAICLAGVLCAAQIQSENDSVYMETGDMELVQEEGA